MPIWKISLSTRRPAKYIKVPTTRGKPSEGERRGSSDQHVQGRQEYENSRDRRWLRQSALALLPSPGNDHDSRHAVSLLGQTEIRVSNIITSSAIKLTVRKPSESTLLLGKGLFVRNDTWSNVSFRNSNGSVEFSPVMTNVTLRSSPLFLLLPMLFY